MGSILADLTLKQAIQQIALRTERVDYDSAVASFYDCNIISHLTRPCLKNKSCTKGQDMSN